MSNDERQERMRATLLLSIEEACTRAGVREEAAKELRELGMPRFAEAVQQSKKGLQRAAGFGQGAADKFEKLALENYLQLEMPPRLVAEILGEPTPEMRMERLQTFLQTPISKMGLSRNAYNFLYRNSIRNGADLLKKEKMPGRGKVRGKEVKAEVAAAIEAAGGHFGTTEAEIAAIMHEREPTPEPSLDTFALPRDAHLRRPGGGSTGAIVADIAAGSAPVPTSAVPNPVVEAFGWVLSGLAPNAKGQVVGQATEGVRVLLKHVIGKGLAISEDDAIGLLEAYAAVFSEEGGPDMTSLGRFAGMLWGTIKEQSE